MALNTQPSIDALLNNFATRCFRDTADRDYIMARMAYRARLIQPFQWSSLHCLEKYVKCALMLNRVPRQKLGHTVLPGLDLLKERGKLEIQLDTGAREFIERLEEGAKDRYYQLSYQGVAFDVMRLDRAVSTIRRYCQPLDDFEVDGQIVNHRAVMLARIKDATDTYSKKTLLDGWLESVMENKIHPARQPLLWKNGCFGPSTRKSVRFAPDWEAGNAPLSLHPEILDEVSKYCFIDSDISKMYSEYAKTRGR